MKKGKKRAITGFGVFLTLVLIFAIVFYFNVTTIQVSGLSMFPTFKNGQRLLVSKAYWLVGPIKDKDIVVVKDPEGPGNIIKRVFRMSGEDVDLLHRPDGVPLNTKGKYTVPDGCVYLLGDNPPVSEDSRKFGPVPMDKIVGKVIVYR
jgi:signal peptidase I